MKLFHNFGTTLFLALAIVVTSCGGGPIEHGKEYILEAPMNSADVDMQSTVAVLENRLNNFGLKGDFELSRDSNRITVRVRQGAIADDSKMRKLLQSSANLVFRAMYTMGEISPVITEAQQTYIRINHIDSITALSAGIIPYAAESGWDPEGALIISCRAKDTMAVMNILRTDSIAILFPSDVVFHWGTGPELETGELTYGLFACKVGRNYVMSGNYIESADALLNPNYNSWEISLVFDPVGAKEFSRITKDNVGRNLAIELDDFVYNYPTVNAEITGGVAVITGNFTETEAGDLAKILSAGSLPLPVALVQETDF